MLQNFKKWVDNNHLVLIFITIYFLISIIKIEHPGVNNDQLMFVNSATLHPDNMFLWKSWNSIPVMIFPYIGALKSYLYMPVFYFFGVNIWSIRLPQIILISITWFIFYKILLMVFNKNIALLTILFLSIDPSVIIYSKLDQGPTVLEFLLKIVSIYLLFLYLRTKKSIFYFSIFPVLALGIFNKLNFFWFANAFLISFLIFYWKPFYNDFRRFDKLLPFLIIILPYLFLLKLFSNLSREVILSYKNFSGIDISNIGVNLLAFKNNLINIVNGNVFFNIIYGYNPTNIGMYFSGLIFIILFIGGFILIRNKSEYRRNYIYFVIIIVLIILQLLLTKNAVSAWHALSIYPMFTIILAIAIIEIYSIVRLRIRQVFILLIISIIFYQFTINYVYISKYSKPTKKVAYTSKIYDLIDFAKHKKTKFICLDVDICNQLTSLTQQKGKFNEPFSFLDPDTYNNSFIKQLENFKKPEEFLYIDHSEENSHFPKFKNTFFKNLDGNKIKYQKIKIFKDGETVVFEVYKIGN